jgi:hypothetical protein
LKPDAALPCCFQVNTFEAKLMVSQAEAEAMLAAMSLEEWFSVMTSRMDSMDQVQGALAMEIRSLAQRSMNSDADCPVPDMSEETTSLSDVDLIEGIRNDVQSDLQDIVEKEWHIGMEHIQLQAEVRDLAMLQSKKWLRSLYSVMKRRRFPLVD